MTVDDLTIEPTFATARQVEPGWVISVLRQKHQVIGKVAAKIDTVHGTRLGLVTSEGHVVLRCTPDEEVGVLWAGK